jgi:predicted tellurium resistance membrane protein TerC
VLCLAVGTYSSGTATASVSDGVNARPRPALAFITAVGMAQQLWVMAVAVALAVGVMLAFSGAVSAFVHRHPTIQKLALSFLILIAVMLVAEGIETHIERGYIYLAMAFSLIVELLNQRLRTRAASAARKLTGESSP